MKVGGTQPSSSHCSLATERTSSAAGDLLQDNNHNTAEGGSPMPRYAPSQSDGGSPYITTGSETRLDRRQRQHLATIEHIRSQAFTSPSRTSQGIGRFDSSWQQARLSEVKKIDAVCPVRVSVYPRLRYAPPAVSRSTNYRLAAKNRHPRAAAGVHCATKYSQK